MSFIKRAREVAGAAAEGAQQAAGTARIKAGELAASASHTAADPATHERLGQQAKEALSSARRGVSTIVERIDPGMLADLIIKATALQEKTNASLRDKKAPYRIIEISITASIPPGIQFTIGRIDEGEILGGTAVSSTELLETLPAGEEGVVALDATSGDASVEASQPST